MIYSYKILVQQCYDINLNRNMLCIICQFVDLKILIKINELQKMIIEILLYKKQCSMIFVFI